MPRFRSGLRLRRTIIQRTDTQATDRSNSDLYEKRRNRQRRIDCIGARTLTYRVGGYQFSRQPVRDAEAASSLLSAFQNVVTRTIRIIDEEGNGIRGR